MSPSVELSPQTFARLQEHAVPLIDSIESVINRLVDYYESKTGAPAYNSGDGARGKIRQFNPLTPPNLKWTKVLAVEFCGKELPHSEVTWNGLMFASIREAKAITKSMAEFKKLVTINFISGEKTNEGYKFFSDLGISVQGQDANSAWRAACRIVQQLSCQLKITFVWRQKDGAAFPGETGQFSIGKG